MGCRGVEVGMWGRKGGCGGVGGLGGISEKFRNRPQESVVVAVVYARVGKQRKKAYSLTWNGELTFLSVGLGYRDATKGQGEMVLIDHRRNKKASMKQQICVLTTCTGSPSVSLPDLGRP